MPKESIKKNPEAYNFFEQRIAGFFPATQKITICRDRKDNFLLALAKDAGADFLITRGEDLLILKQFENTSIVTCRNFLKSLIKIDKKTFALHNN